MNMSTSHIDKHNDIKRQSVKKINFTILIILSYFIDN